uniref:hypothetical protein n=1 Tax=Ornithobacterium rhinotracheale TaxID=28251 RepID=UPI0039A7059D
MQQENSYLRLYNYFKAIAEANVHINGFAGYFQRDLSNKLESYEGLSSPYLALWDYEKEYQGDDRNTVAVISLGYVILKSDVPPDDIEAQYAAIDECEKIAKSVNARLRYDNHDKSHFLFGSFLKEQTKIQPIDTEDLGFGVQVEVFFKNPEHLALKPEDWADIDMVCG